MRKIAVAMAKGGVGKTTTAVNLAHGLSLKGRRVLLVDCDTQAQTAKFLGVSPLYGLYEFVRGCDEAGRPVSRNETLFPARPNLWLLAGGIKLVELKNWLGEQPREVRQTLLKETLVPRDGAIDYMIFDCAPGWDVLSVNILMAAGEVLCPVALQAPALEGLKTFFGYLMAAQRLNTELELRYVLPTLFDQRTRQSLEIYRKLKRLFQKQICDPIRTNVRLSEAPAKGQSIFEYQKNATGAVDYARLIRRVSDDDGRKKGFS
ncbi:MAG: ParA family protein [Desulfobacterales bacterium]